MPAIANKKDKTSSTTPMGSQFPVEAKPKTIKPKTSTKAGMPTNRAPISGLQAATQIAIWATVLISISRQQQSRYPINRSPKANIRYICLAKSKANTLKKVITNIFRKLMRG
jgi:hypothetical protein